MAHRTSPADQRVSPARERFGTAAIWLLVLASIVLWPDAFVRWFLPKDALAAIAVVLASLSGARGRLPRWFVAASAVAAVVALAAVLMSAAPAAQLWGRWPRYEGLVTLPVYFGAVWAGARLLGPGAPASGERMLVRAASLAATLLGVVSLLEGCGVCLIPSDLARPGALTGNATDQGILGALFLALLALPVLRAWTARPTAGVGVAPAMGALERVALSVALLFALATVILSASRAGLLGALVVLLTLAAHESARLHTARRRTNSTEISGTKSRIAPPTPVSGKNSVELVHPGLRTLAVTGGTVLLLVGGALAVPFTRDRLLGASPLSGSSLEARFAYWQQSLAALAGHPLGVGASGFLNANAPASTGADTLDSPHNWVFQVLLAGGLPLLVVVLGIVVAAAVVGVRAWRGSTTGHADAGRADLLAAAGAGLAGFGVALLTHFTAPSTTILAALLIGVLVSRAPEADTKSGSAVVPDSGTGSHSTAGSGSTVTSRPTRGAGASATSRRFAPGIRSVLLLGWAVWLIVLSGADVPLAAGVTAAAHGDVAGAEASFDRARALRPWDADLTSIAAQALAAAADARVAGAAEPTVLWAERSRALLPGTVATERALAVGQLNAGDLAGARSTLASLAALAPNDVAVAVQHAVALYLAGDVAAAGLEDRRALALDPADPAALTVRHFLAGH